MREKSRRVTITKPSSKPAGVTSMPTLEFYRNGEKIATMVGANIVELKERVNRELMNPMLKLVSGKVAVGALLGAYLVLPWQRILAN